MFTDMSLIHKISKERQGNTMKMNFSQKFGYYNTKLQSITVV